jgi:NADPH:quinone reductase-like Zn-dependent oxidoreductase
MDVAGVVEAVGTDVTTYQTGDEVIAMLGAKFGGHVRQHKDVSRAG